ncbi:hypothetical protein RvY_15246 [Ramazzottius varieornatus]|uniref:Uncharacterized protein n=1 Tax=Ramazzottius varieornatus TaxID=947166 RepID=A0A1D1VU99_RAMVA|nr:hypothetical protein RvY_15246 [Ramazzottius varieornatus]
MTIWSKAIDCRLPYFAPFRFHHSIGSIWALAGLFSMYASKLSASSETYEVLAEVVANVDTGPEPPLALA